VGGWGVLMMGWRGEGNGGGVDFGPCGNLGWVGV